MHIQLIWKQPVTKEQQQQTCQVPIAIGRIAKYLPTTLHQQQVTQIVLTSDQISYFHLLITCLNGILTVTDRSINGTFLNGKPIHKITHPLISGDILQIGPYTIKAIVPKIKVNPESTIIFDPATKAPKTPKTLNTSPALKLRKNPPPAPPPTNPCPRFPPPKLFACQQLSINAIYATGIPVEEIDYAAIGGGIGSFAWVDTLRISGVKPEQIAILSVDKKPYSRYQRLCNNSQIQPLDRIRSGSDSCPDNIWGWPGYALRESVRELFSGRILNACKPLWQVFTEPLLATTYTPRAQDVFLSMDREAKRIGWEEMLRYGRVLSIRQTDDGRYCIAYSVPKPRELENRFLLARYIHIATGYPAIRFLPDMQSYRSQTRDFKSVVNCYENHKHIYEYLARKGGSVVVRGRGIAASRVIEKLGKIRSVSYPMTIIHLMRSPKFQGQKFGFTQRQVNNHWELQVYNWPKSCIGGDFRAKLEAVDPMKRSKLLENWGGTTTSDRPEWQQLITKGLEAGWYLIKFGEVKRIKSDQNGKLLIYICSRKERGIEKIEADFALDCTGVENQVIDNPLLNDLVTHYKLPLNPLGKLAVNNDFEIREMRNSSDSNNRMGGRIYAAGIITLGGPYAPVDSFLGLQYSAHRSAAALVQARASGISRLEGIGSLWQWFKWVINLAP
ncbi:MAG: FHA domain-containing protein [Microcoleaceae cyanobacterium]